MSTSGLTSPNLSVNEGQEKYSALLIAVSLMGVIIALLLVRLAFNLFIDLCILCDSELALRNGAEAFRKVCPWWHRRTQPTPSEADAAPEQRRRDEENDEESGLEEDIVLDYAMYKETLSRYLQELLPSEIYLPHATTGTGTESDASSSLVQAVDECTSPPSDLEGEVRIDVDASHSSFPPSSCPEGGCGNDLPCSICLLAIVRGASVVRVARCGHVFHPACLQEWLVPKRDTAVGNNHCPNCRTPVVETNDLERLLAWMRRQETLRAMMGPRSLADRQERMRQRNRRIEEDSVAS